MTRQYLEEKRAGAILESRESAAARATVPDRNRRTSRIPPKTVESRKYFDEDPGAFPPGADERTDVISGVIAATVSTNRLMPLSVSPSSWDVLANYFAEIDGGFSGFRLPAVGVKLGYYATGLMSAEFATEDFDLDPPKQNLFNVREQKSYAIQAVARCNQDGLLALTGASDNNVTVMGLEWGGPWSAEEQYLMSVDIEPHVTPVGTFSHSPTSGNISVLVPPVDVVETGT
jgi:hypothetical protein